MSKRALSWLAVGLILAAPPALAQMSGGQGGGMGGSGQSGGIGGGGHSGHGGRGNKSGDQTAKKPAGPTPVDAADKPTNLIEITGVVTAIDPATSRLTIAYDAVDELNWPRGTMPFPVAKDDLLKDRKVGEKIVFKVSEHEIYEIAPYTAPKPAVN